MAKSPKNPDALTLFTPRGTFIWPKLTEPDHGTEKFPCKHEWGEYKTKFRMDKARPGVAAFLEKLDAHMEVARKLAEEAFAELPVKDRKRIGEVVADEPYAVVYDDETEEETNFIEMSAKMRAGGRRKKDNKPWSAKPDLFDSKGKPIVKKIEVWGGSTGILNITLEPYFVPATGKYGLSRRLNAAQIIELVAAGGTKSASSYGFGAEEDGFSQDDYVADDSEDETEGDSASGDEDDDHQF